MSSRFALESKIDRPDVRSADTLANERTYLAYVRTALAFIAFGFVIARFSLFAREFSQLAHQSVPSRGLSVGFGTGMAIFGTVVGVLGAWRYSSTDRALRRSEVVTLSSSAAYAGSLFVAVVGTIVAVVLLAYR
jgi:putative membrane protein